MVRKGNKKTKTFNGFRGSEGEAGLGSDVCLSANDVHFVNDVRLTTDDVFASQRLWLKL